MASLAEYRALFDLAQTYAVVIGAGSGIGEACTSALAAHGALDAVWVARCFCA